MNLTEYRASSSEQLRTADLLRLMPATGRLALDVGARDGHFSILLADRFEKVVALDLTLPGIAHPRVECVQGNAAELQFPDGSFDFVFCAEVLEHVPTSILRKVCSEIERVACARIVVGVPYRQDLRVGRTTCSSCGKQNPPWGHVNSFDEEDLKKLFPSCQVESIAFVGSNTSRTNSLSAALMDFAGNPYGTYDQEEPCVHCGASLVLPPRRNLVQLIATKLGFWSRKATELLEPRRGNWIHIALRKIDAT